MTDLVIPAGRQGPGRLPSAAIAAVDVALARRVGGILPGEHRSAGVGVGTELAQLRPYEPGDDLRQLDPAASARTNIPHVRMQVPERALTTWLVLDVSASMAFGTQQRLKSDIAEGVAQVVAQVAVRRGGRIAMLTAGGPTTHLLPPRGGRRAVASIRRLVEEGVAPDGAGAEHGLVEALGRVRQLATQRGLVLIVSDFRDGGDWARSMRSLGMRHALVAVEVCDQRETSLPDAGLLTVVDPETGQQTEADTSSPKLRAAFARAGAERSATLAAAFRRAGAAHVVLDTDSDWLRDLASKLR